MATRSWCKGKEAGGDEIQKDTDFDRLLRLFEAGNFNLLTGHPAMAICDYAKEHECDLIALATHGRTGIAHLLIGSTAEQVVRHAPCPVLSLRLPV